MPIARYYFSRKMYLGKEHKFYQFAISSRILSKANNARCCFWFFKYKTVPNHERSLLSNMIYAGKELPKRSLLPNYSDAEKMGTRQNR
jgi:hypothetical protein